MSTQPLLPSMAFQAPRLRPIRRGMGVQPALKAAASFPRQLQLREGSGSAVLPAATLVISSRSCRPGKGCGGRGVEGDLQKTPTFILPGNGLSSSSGFSKACSKSRFIK